MSADDVDLARRYDRRWQADFSSVPDPAPLLYFGNGGLGPDGSTHVGVVCSFNYGQTWGYQVIRLNPKHGGTSGGRNVAHQSDVPSLREAIESVMAIVRRIERR